MGAEGRRGWRLSERGNIRRCKRFRKEAQAAGENGGKRWREEWQKRRTDDGKKNEDFNGDEGDKVRHNLVV